MTSAAAEKMQCLLNFGLCLATRSRGWIQHCGMVTLRLSAAVCVFTQSRKILFSLHWEEERREKDGLWGNKFL